MWGTGRPAAVPLIAGHWTVAGSVGPHMPDPVSPHSFEARIERAACAGFSGIGLGHRDLLRHLPPDGLAPLRRSLDAHGLEIVELELLKDWFADGERRAESDRVRRHLLAVAAEIGARHIKVAGDADRDAAWPLDRLAGEFHRLCEDARAVGARIALEIAPMSSVFDIASARAIIGTAGHPAGGLMLDIWHIARAGIPYDELRAIEAESITAVELCDASREVAGPLWEDTVLRRLLCGEGDLDVPHFIEAVAAAGYRGPYGVEIISDAHRQRPLAEQARLAFATTASQFNALLAAS